MLDCFTSTGGFALHAAAQGGIGRSGGFFGSRARDRRSQRAARTASRNIQFRQADVFEFLSGISSAAIRWSCWILRPSRNRGAPLDDAARGYKEINLRALRLLDPGGILVTCSCSHHMSEGGCSTRSIAEAALDAGKTLRVLERRTQAADHPILLTVPETLYLKCLILEVL